MLNDSKNGAKRMYSKALGVEFLRLEDETCDIEGVMYTPREVRLLMASKGNAEEVRAVHAVKKMFDGEILTRGAPEEVRHAEYTRVGRAPRGKVWDSKQHKYIG